jgi:DNA-binding NarL/FixJ family response regulator/class 3 adenylate cyclase
VTGERFTTIVVAELDGLAALFEQRGDDAADAVRRERFAALRNAVDSNDGREVRTTGDGIVAAFASAASALRCAVAMQRETGEAGLALRIGVDAGEPVPDGDDLYGTPVIVAGRLCDTAGPGEILVTDVASRIAAPRLDVPVQAAGQLKLRGADGRVPTVRVLWRDASVSAEPAAPAAQITTVIVDDERLLRTGFRVILETEPDITVVGEAENGRAALDVVRRRRPDVVLMDIRMPELDGIRAAEELLADPDLETAVIMLTTFDLDEYVYDALRIGASGFLLKDTPADRLLDAVRVAASGDALLAPSITRRLIERFTATAGGAGAPPPELAELTDRELEVLRLIARGLSNAEIAAELVLTENTVKTHVAHVLSKLGLRDRVQAVVLAYESGLVERALPHAASERPCATPAAMTSPRRRPSIRLPPIASTTASSGLMTRTDAPRRRTASASALATLRDTTLSGERSCAVGLRQMTRSPRPALDASRFVGLHTPPST